MTNLTDWQRLLADVATGVWRLRQRLPALDAAPDDQRRTVRDVEALWRRLQEGGVQVLDHTGEVYDGTKSLRVLAFEPAPQLAREQVVETVKPTIYYNRDWIQTGEVVVGMPAQPDRRAAAEQ
jgi:hypothetical protein